MISDKFNGIEAEAPFMAVDYGTKNIGLAVSDRNGQVSTPIETLIYTRNRGDEELIAELLEFIRQHRIKSLVIGYPQAFIEKHTQAQEKIDIFIEKLIEKTALPVIKYDESYSTVNATDMLLSLGQNSKKSRGKIDKVSAALFLQEFLDNRNQQISQNETI